MPDYQPSTMSDKNINIDDKETNKLNSSSAPLAISVNGEVRKRSGLNMWRKWIRAVGIINISHSSHGGSMDKKRAAFHSDNTTSVTTKIINISHLLQVLMSFFMILSSRMMQNIERLFLFLRIYVLFSYVLMATLACIIVTSIGLITESNIIGYERFQRIFGSTVNLINQILSAWFLEKFLVRHGD